MAQGKATQPASQPVGQLVSQPISQSKGPNSTPMGVFCPPSHPAVTSCSRTIPTTATLLALYRVPTHMQVQYAGMRMVSGSGARTPPGRPPTPPGAPSPAASKALQSAADGCNAAAAAGATHAPSALQHTTTKLAAQQALTTATQTQRANAADPTPNHSPCSQAATAQQ